MIELASWDETHDSIVDRSDRPWDSPNRRPSHEDRKRKIAKEMLQNEFFESSTGRRGKRKFQTLS